MKLAGKVIWFLRDVARYGLLVAVAIALEHRE